MERLIELFEATMDQDPTGDMGFQQLEGLCTQQNIDPGATFCTIAMALETKHPIPSQAAYLKALAAIDMRLKSIGSRASKRKQAQWEKCVVLQQLGKMCVIHERAADAIKHLKQSLDIPTGAPPEKILDVMNFTGTPNHFVRTTHKMLARAYIFQARKNECDPALIETHLKLSEQALQWDSRAAQNDKGTRWPSLPVQRHFGYSFSERGECGERVEVYLQASVASKDDVDVTQPDETALDARWQKNGTEYWFHLCPMEPTVVEDTTYRVSATGKLTIVLYFASKRLIRSSLVSNRGTCDHIPSVKQPPPEEQWPENVAPQHPEKTVKTPQKWTPQTAPCSCEKKASSVRTTATHNNTASTALSSAWKPATVPRTVTRRSRGATVAPLEWDDDTPVASSSSQPTNARDEAQCAPSVVSAAKSTSTLERTPDPHPNSGPNPNARAGAEASTAIEQKAEAVDGPDTASMVTRSTANVGAAADEVIRDGGTLIVRLPAEPGVDLDLKSDVLRVSGMGGAYRDIYLGCCVDVGQCRAKKRRGMIEVHLSVP